LDLIHHGNEQQQIFYSKTALPQIASQTRALKGGVAILVSSSLFPHLASKPGVSGEGRVPAFVERSRFGQDDPGNPGHLGGKGNDNFIREYSGLEAI
jgi:hypothetical protein